MAEKSSKHNIYYEAAKALSESTGRSIAEILSEMQHQNVAVVTSEKKMKVGDYIATDHQIHKAQTLEQDTHSDK